MERLNFFQDSKYRWKMMSSCCCQMIESRELYGHMFFSGVYCRPCLEDRFPDVVLFDVIGCVLNGKELSVRSSSGDSEGFLRKPQAE